MTPQNQPVTWTSGTIAVAWSGVIFVLLALPLSHLWQGLVAEDLNPATWRTLFSEPAWIAQVMRSVIVAVLAAGIAAALALPAAIVVDRAPTLLKLLALGLAMAVFTVPLDVLATTVTAGTAELTASLSWPDSANTLADLALVYGLRFATLLLLILAVALHFRSRSQAEAALCHGIGPMTAWLRFTLPQLTPALSLGVVWIGLFVLNDPALPTLLGSDPLLATTALLQPASGTGTPKANQAAIMLMLLGLMTIVLAWRALVPSTRSGDPLGAATLARQFGFGRPSLLLGVVALLTAWAWHDLAITDLGSLEPMLAAGASLALLGGAAALLARRTDPFSRFVQQSLPLLLLLTPLMVLNAPTPLSGLAASAGITPQDTRVVLSGLALVAPWLILVAYLGRHLPMHTSPGLAKLAESCGGPTRATPRRIALTGVVQLIIGLFCFGAALAIIAANPLPTGQLPPWDITQ